MDNTSYWKINNATQNTNDHKGVFSIIDTKLWLIDAYKAYGNGAMV